MSVWEEENPFCLGDTHRGSVTTEVRVTASQTHRKLLHPAVSSHSTVFMTTVNILTITALITQIFMSFPNKSVFFLSSWLTQSYGKIARNYTWFMTSTIAFSFGALIVHCCFFTYVKLQRLCRIHVCLVTSSFKSQYHLESALTLHLET